MIDEARSGLSALGCFFETDGGILLDRSAGRRLLDGGRVRLASPVAGGVTDAIAIEILARWCRRQGADFDEAQVVIESAGFAHLQNLQQGYDGAWLCFANFEGVEARILGVDAVFTGSAFLAEHPQVVATVTDLISRGAALCRDNPTQAARLWYAHSGETPGALMDAIIADTCPRLVSPVRRDAGRWRAMWAQFDAMGLSRVDAEGYEALYR
jgi:putative hydroxymethylpyrimidine transport system substrate-binding protein